MRPARDAPVLLRSLSWPPFSHSSALCPLCYQAPGARSEGMPDRAQQQRRCQQGRDFSTHLVCGTTPARQARLKERGGPDAPAPDTGVLGGIQLGAGEVVVVAIQSAGDQHLPVWEQSRGVLNAGGMQAAGGGPGACRRVVQFGAGDERGPVLAAGDQHLPVREQGGRVLVARGVQATGQRPGPGGGVVEFGAGEEAAAALPGGDEHLPTGEQRCRVTGPGGVHIAGQRPLAGGGVVQLRTGENVDGRGGVIAAGDEHLAALQQRHGVVEAGGVQAAGGTPGALNGIVQFRAGEERRAAILVIPAGDQDLPVLQEGRRVLIAGGMHAAGSDPGAGGGVVQLRAGERADRSRATGDEDLTIGEQGGAGSVVGGVQVAGGGPAAGGGVVEFGAGALSADDEHLAVGEQGRRGVRTRDMQAAG
jgi:hypothetical protein